MCYLLFALPVCLSHTEALQQHKNVLSNRQIDHKTTNMGRLMSMCNNLTLFFIAFEN